MTTAVYLVGRELEAFHYFNALDDEDLAGELAELLSDAADRSEPLPPAELREVAAACLVTARRLDAR